MPDGEARTGPLRPAKQSGTRELCAVPSSVVRASSSKAQRVRRPQSELVTREILMAAGAPFCASSSEDKRLRKLSKICMALPGATRELKGSHATFRIEKKVFAYFLNDHHGDGIVSVCCKVFANDNLALIAADPKRFYMPAYIGPRGWVGLRLDVGNLDWDEVEELVKGSHRLTTQPVKKRAQI